MKDVKGYEGLYAVSSCGKVWSYRRQKFLKPAYNGHGYLSVSLCDLNGKQKSYRVNRLVAEAYIPNPDNKPIVNHKDAVRHNNNINNLEWVSAKENLTGVLVGKKKTFSKVKCVETGEVYKNCADASRETGIHRYGINNVLNGKQKTAGGYHWERVGG